MNSVSINFAMVDFTNPEAREWVKDMIKENMLGEAGAWGWMHDFGEYVPLDSTTFDGADPFFNHNDYPRQWAEVCREAIAEANRTEDIVYFMRSGSTLSPQDTGLFWMGDQMPTFDQYDGLHSAMMGLLNGGLSGLTLGHSDIGGYTTVYYLHGGFEYVRSKELLERWIEMNTFSDMMMRTHPGLTPAQMYQVWDDPETTDFFAKFVTIHSKVLKEYKLNLMRLAHTEGQAPTRALLVEFPDDAEARKIQDQFMLGEDLMMAPVFKSRQKKRNVYFPKGSWTHYFTKQ